MQKKRKKIYMINVWHFIKKPKPLLKYLGIILLLLINMKGKFIRILKKIKLSRLEYLPKFGTGQVIHQWILIVLGYLMVKEKMEMEIIERTLTMVKMHFIRWPPLLRNMGILKRTLR